MEYVNPTPGLTPLGNGWRADMFAWRACGVVNPTPQPPPPGAGWRAGKFAWRACGVVNPTPQPPPRSIGEGERVSGADPSESPLHVSRQLSEFWR